MLYNIAEEKDRSKFELTEKNGIWSLYFKKRVKEPSEYNLILYGKPVVDPEFRYPKEAYAKSFSLWLRIVVTE